MEIRPIDAGGPSDDGSVLKIGDKIQVNIIKSHGDGSYSFNSGGKLFQGFSDTPLNPGRQQIQILSVEPKLEIAPFGKEKSESLFQIGSKISVEVISVKDGAYSVNLGGKTYIVNIVPPPLASKFIGEIVKTDPLLELKPVFTSLKDITLPFMAREMASFNQRDISSIMKMFTGASLSAFLPEEIRRVIKDGGNFFENKLSRGLAPGGDVKFSAYQVGDDNAAGNITKMQIANILMAEDFFSFFEGDDLDFEGGVMRFRKSDNGSLNLYMKLDFTNLGDTVVSFLKSSELGYYVTVRTEKDISEELAKVDLEGCRLNWRKLGDSDKELFNIKSQDFKGLEGLDIKI